MSRLSNEEIDHHRAEANAAAYAKNHAEKSNALDNQVGGNHYKKYAIQPAEFCQKNELNFCESNVIKYVSRHRQKGGVECLKKAKHYIDLLIQIEYS